MTLSDVFRAVGRHIGLACSFAVVVALATAASASFVEFESGQVRPLAMSPDGGHLFAVNTPDNRLEIFTVDGSGLTPAGSVPVGLEPVAVAARTNSEVWVVNHLSDSISIVDVAATPPRVVRTLLVGDEPRDIVFAGPGGNRAFITTARRGQNLPASVPPLLTTPSVPRALVFVFDATNLGDALTGTPLTVVKLFGDTPRALAATPDGSKVYAAVFHSGNQTTTVSEGVVCNDNNLNNNAVAGPCTIQGTTYPGGLPLPEKSSDGVNRPETGLIVKFNPANNRWEDQLARNWNNAVRFNLPDEDVFVIDANANPPAQVAGPSGVFAGVGTVLFNMVVNPAQPSRVYVSNTEAVNEVRFEGPGVLGGSTVRGHLHEARITVLDGTAVLPRHLNKHINYSVVPSPMGVKDKSLATPVGLAVTGDGATLYVTAFGSSAIGVFDATQLLNDTFVADSLSHIAVSGGGPSGLVLDEAHQRLYVLTRFDNSISVVDTVAPAEVDHIALHNPEPANVLTGRPFLYDAVFTSSNGEASCSSCHVFGDFDSLAWDLGDPDGAVVPDPNPTRTDKGPPPPAPDFHPMKGPMTTQTLRGIGRNGPMHWRGDRTGAYVPGGDPFDERAAFLQFSEAFVSLLGNETPLADAAMGELADFALAITPPPNPIRNLDESFTPAQQIARDAFFADGSCTTCHRDDPTQGFFGTDGFTAPNEAALPQFMKIPHLDNIYQKVGMFERRPPANNGDTTPVGPQVRGFGYLHNGSQGFPPSGETEFPFLMAFDAPLAPIVGQQMTLAGAPAAGVAASRIDLLAAQAALGRCDLVVKGAVDGIERGWVRTATGQFTSDRVWEPPLADETLRALAAAPGQALTYTCVPPGSGMRVGVDRDEDGALDGDERDAGSDPADAASVPLRCDGGSSPTAIRLKIARRRGDSGGGTVVVRGIVTLAPPVDPLVGGFRLNLIGTNGRFLVARALAANAPGWRILKAGKSWRYRDPAGTQLTIRQAGALGRFRFAGRFADLAAPVNPADLGALVVALDGDARCARAAFGSTGLRCRANAKRVECR
jgi:DNA-binding beta-propeller fold protein YncE